MMGTMSEGNSVDPGAGDGQPDLFDDHGRVEGELAPPPSVLPAGPAAAELTDGEVIAMLPQAGRSNVEALSIEVVSRSLAEAVPALEALWHRFSGFGVKVPYPEQRAVLSTLARLECEAARAALRAIVLSKGVPASLLPAAARAAAEAGLGLPAAFVAPLLVHEDVAVREPAFALAVQSGIGSGRLRDGLTDASPAVRRLAAIAMGMRGDAEARERLVDELERNPTAEVIEALAAIGTTTRSFISAGAPSAIPPLRRASSTRFAIWRVRRGRGSSGVWRRLARERLRGAVLLETAGMAEAGDKPGSAGARRAGRPRYVLPSDLSGSLRRLDDGQLDRLLRAVAEEVRRRGLRVDDGRTPPPSPAPGKVPGSGPAAGARVKKRALPIAPGQAKVIRAAFEAGVKPATIARQFRVSRAQVEQIVGKAGPRK